MPAPGRTDSEQQWDSLGEAAPLRHLARHRRGTALQTCSGRRPRSWLPRRATYGQRCGACVRGAVSTAGWGGGARPRLRPWPAPWRASCIPALAAAAARLPGCPGQVQDPISALQRLSACEPAAGCSVSPESAAPRPGRSREPTEQGADRARRPGERRAHHVAAAAARAGAGLPRSVRRPRLLQPRSVAGLPASRTPRRQGHGGAAGSEPRPGVPETSEQAPVRAAAATTATASPAGLRAGPWMKGSTSGC